MWRRKVSAMRSRPIARIKMVNKGREIRGLSIREVIQLTLILGQDVT